MAIVSVIYPLEQGTYVRGETIRATLLVRWRERSDAVVVEFHKLDSPFGGKPRNRIELRSRSTKQIKPNQARTSR